MDNLADLFKNNPDLLKLFTGLVQNQNPLRQASDPNSFWGDAPKAPPSFKPSSPGDHYILPGLKASDIAPGDRPVEQGPVKSTDISDSPWHPSGGPSSPGNHYLPPGSADISDSPWHPSGGPNPQNPEQVIQENWNPSGTNPPPSSDYIDYMKKLLAHTSGDAGNQNPFDTPAYRPGGGNYVTATPEPPSLMDQLKKATGSIDLGGPGMDLLMGKTKIGDTQSPAEPVDPGRMAPREPRASDPDQDGDVHKGASNPNFEKMQNYFWR